MREDIPRDALWTPDNGWTSVNERQVAKAVEEYDASLVLGQRQDTGEWVVFLRNGPHQGEAFPLLGLGHELPSADKVKELLFKRDVKRNGAKIYDDIVRSMESKRREAKSAASDASGQAAEALEYGFRKMGKHPSPRVFIPAGVKV